MRHGQLKADAYTKAPIKKLFHQEMGEQLTNERSRFKKIVCSPMVRLTNRVKLLKHRESPLDELAAELLTKSTFKSDDDEQRAYVAYLVSLGPMGDC